jgi:hypothetical protein
VPQTRPREPKRIPHRANRLHSRNAARE